MKNLSPLGRVIFVLGAVLLILPLLTLGTYAARKYEWATTTIETINPRYARLLGLRNAAPALEAAVAGSKGAMTAHVYPASQDVSRVGNALHERITRQFKAAGVQVITSQVMDTVQDGGFDRIPLTIRVECDVETLQKALFELREQTPLVLVDSMRINALGVGKVGQVRRLNVQFNLFALRERP